jgi:hypothetical protein
MAAKGGVERGVVEAKETPFFADIVADVVAVAVAVAVVAFFDSAGAEVGLLLFALALLCAFDELNSLPLSLSLSLCRLWWAEEC